MVMARVRLHGLMGTYPNDLGLRYILGQMYLELDKPWKAGKYLYLIGDTTDATHEAITEFLILCDAIPKRILWHLKVRGHIDDYAPGYAKDKLQDLLEDCGITDGKFPEKVRGKISRLDCGIAIVVFLGVLYVGYLFIKWIIRLIGNLIDLM